LSSLEKLFDRIKEDKNSFRITDRRFPIRFIFINSFDELRRIIDFLIEKSFAEKREINELLIGKNLWITEDEILEWVNRISKNSVIVPLSEFIRFQDRDEFYTIFKGLTEIENRDNIRIYVPLVGLWERFKQEFWDKFYRKEEWGPIWKVEGSSSVNSKIIVYQLDFDLDYQIIPFNDFYVISSIKEWFEIWKKENVKKILSLYVPFSRLCENFLPDKVFELKKIFNQKEFISEIYGINILVKFKNNEESFWNRLIKEINNLKINDLSYEKLFLNYFNWANIDREPKEFLKLFFETESSDIFERWFIKNTFLLKEDKYKDSYLYKCFEKLEDLNKESLLKKIWLEIFQIPSNELEENIFGERKEFLNYIHEKLKIPISEDLEISLNNSLKEISNYTLVRKLRYLTDITITEKKFIIEQIKGAEKEKVIKILKDIYPNLSNYLNWDLIKPDNNLADWIIEYFKEYNFSKLKNVKSDKIIELIEEKNKKKETFTEWFYSIPLFHKIEDINNSTSVWIDGLGAEWFPLVVSLFEKYGKEKGKFVKEKMITRVNLPSSTECNRYKFDKKFDVLDSYIHDENPYKYPEDLIEEINIIEKIVKEILEIPSDRIFIYSDHGFTFLCLKDFGNFKKLNFESAEHEGRYMWIGKEDYDDEYFMSWEVDDGECKNKKALIALKHVSLNNTPYREVHGGATPEEVLVPFIVIETSKEKVDYKIEPTNFEIEINNPTIKFKIKPHPRYHPEAFLNTQSVGLIRYNTKDDLFILDLKDIIKTGEYVITLKIGEKEYKINVKIKGGFKERDLL